MKKTILPGVLALLALLTVGTLSTNVSQAEEHDRTEMRDGSVVNQFCFASDESRRIREEFGYNWKVAHSIVEKLFSEAGIPSSFTGKVGYFGAYSYAISSTAYLVWDQARRHGSNECWCLKYRTTPRQLKLIDRTLGKVGDKIMPFGEGANMIIGVINDILNTVTATR